MRLPSGSLTPRMKDQTWKQVWAARRLDTSLPTALWRLLAADGMDTGFGTVSEDAWRRYVLATAEKMGITPGASIFEVGCGAGAWLYELARLGCQVAGLDSSPALIGYAREHLPDGDWSVRDAADVDPLPAYDFVVSSAAFLYFPSLDYARSVLERMAGKARHGLLVLDLPDLSKREADLIFRRQSYGESYDDRYRGLNHLYFERDWFTRVLNSLGAARIQIEDQCIDGYGNSRYRFNVFAWQR